MSYPRKRVSSKSLISICTESNWIPAFAGMTRMWDSSDSDPLAPLIRYQAIRMQNIFCIIAIFILGILTVVWY